MERFIRQPLIVAQILAWADAHHKRTGQWPKTNSGRVRANPSEKWFNLDKALRHGRRGLNSGDSLARLLDRERGVRNVQNLPPLTEKLILKWADVYHKQAGKWPTEASGPVPDTRGEIWRNISRALVRGHRGLRGGDSLARLLHRRLGVRNPAKLPRLTVPQILRWADACRRRTGVWPTRHAGSIGKAPGETWAGVDTALLKGLRGLPGGSSLAQVLAEYRGRRNKQHLPRLSLKQIRAWAQAHRKRCGCWPTRHSGPVAEAPGETWQAIESAIRQQLRGLHGGKTLYQVLKSCGRSSRSTRDDAKDGKRQMAG